MLSRRNWTHGSETTMRICVTVTTKRSVARARLVATRRVAPSSTFLSGVLARSEPSATATAASEHIKCITEDTPEYPSRSQVPGDTVCTGIPTGTVVRKAGARERQETKNDDSRAQLRLAQRPSADTQEGTAIKPLEPTFVVWRVGVLSQSHLTYKAPAVRT